MANDNRNADFTNADDETRDTTIGIGVEEQDEMEMEPQSEMSTDEMDKSDKEMDQSEMIDEEDATIGGMSSQNRR